MKTIAYFFSLIFICVACVQSTEKGNSSEDSTTMVETPVSNAAQDFSGSYGYLQGGDTISLHLTMQGAKASGHLTYAWKEKDHNTGSIEGEVKDGILIANYTFDSEGQTSVREVAFKLDGNSATEGYGDVEEKDGKYVYKDVSNLNFDKGMVLTKQ